jgi:hypothetical protein
MKFILPYIILLNLTHCLNGSQESGRIISVDTTKKIDMPPMVINKSFEEILQKYDKKELFVGLYFLKRGYFLKYSNEMDSLNLPFCTIIPFFQKKTSLNDSLLILVNDSLNKETNSSQRKILNDLENWLKNDILLSSIMNNNLSNGMYFEEIIYKIPETKSLIQIYIKNPNQYWGSLDENQSCKIYFDVCNYLTGLKPNNRIKFFKLFFDIACSLASKSLNANHN